MFQNTCLLYSGQQPSKFSSSLIYTAHEELKIDGGASTVGEGDAVVKVFLWRACSANQGAMIKCHTVLLSKLVCKAGARSEL